MLYIGTYGAFGELLDSIGSTVNSYGFAGEQFDSGLDQYYLRARYYDQSSGRFTRRDDYEGRLGEPLTLHKYLYANGNPSNFVDPSGLTPTSDGNWVHEEITEDFLRSTSDIRDADVPIWKIWLYEGIPVGRIPNSIVWINRQNARPDLVDFHSTTFTSDVGEVYEIGTVKQLPEKLAKISGQYLRDINNGLSYAGKQARYTYGQTYRVEPAIRTNFLTGQSALIFPPIGGVISYVMLPNKTSFYNSLIQVTSYALLTYLVSVAAARSARTLGLA